MYTCFPCPPTQFYRAGHDFLSHNPQFYRAQDAACHFGCHMQHFITITSVFLPLHLIPRGILYYRPSMTFQQLQKHGDPQVVYGLSESCFFFFMEAMLKTLKVDLRAHHNTWKTRGSLRQTRAANGLEVYTSFGMFWPFWHVVCLCLKGLPSTQAENRIWAKSGWGGKCPFNRRSWGEKLGRYSGPCLLRGDGTVGGLGAKAQGETRSREKLLGSWLGHLTEEKQITFNQSLIMFKIV